MTKTDNGALLPKKLHDLLSVSINGLFLVVRLSSSWLSGCYVRYVSLAGHPYAAPTLRRDFTSES
ncbi:MAG: hypothetical protein JRH18_15725 [Deltaproteobacteria bacterium]|nr:hypothetical protein [Deltaproteobacteria bacterium]MBW2153104.1 hypothetical protein [Deltaproteobacteria bacterium]